MKNMYLCNCFHMNGAFNRSAKRKALLMLLVIFQVIAPAFLYSIVLAESAAEEVSAEVQVQARALQLEGTSLQLKGDLQGAIEKYKESQKLKPNPSLERLTATLERQIQRKESATNTTKEVAGEISQGDPLEAATPKITRAPASPEEDLIYAFTDWFIGFLPEKDSDTEFGLQTNRDYTIISAGDHYEVRLDNFIVHFDDSNSLDFSPVVFKYNPQDNNRLSVQLILPKQSTFKENDRIVSYMKIGDQTMTGVWNRLYENFEQSKVNLTKISIQDVEHTGKLIIGMVLFDTHFGETEKGLWKELYSGGISDLMLDVDDEDVSFTIQDLSMHYELGGTDFPQYTELRKVIYGKMDEIENEDLEALEELFTSLDRYMELFTSSRATFSLNGFELLADEDEVILDSAAMGFEMMKDPKTRMFAATTKGDIYNFSLHGLEEIEDFDDENFAAAENELAENDTGAGGTEAAPADQLDEEELQPIVIDLEHLYFTDSATINALPKNFFADLFTVIMNAEKAEDKDTYAAEQGVNYMNIFLDLFDGYNGTVGLEGLVVEHDMPNPISIKNVVMQGGFNVNDPQGSAVRSSLSFSGLQGIDTGDNAIPEAASINITLTGIPSIKGLIPDPAQLAGADEDQIKGAVTMNAMQAFMGSALALTMRDTHVTFPKSKLNLGVEAKVNSAAKMMSTGAVQLTVENPDDLMRIIQLHGGDENVQRMLATLTALADRKKVGERVVDSLNMQLNEDGRIYSNNKDVTPLFFPEKAPPTE